ncbi:MAG: hypothetical protein AAF462_09880 [Thermodesulfobacteriota bacterium]
MKTIKSITFAIAVLLLFGISANAQTTIYALGSEVIIEDDFDIIDFDTRQIFQMTFGPTTLYTINPQTGEKSEVGSTGFRECAGLDIHPGTGEFYAVCNRILEDDDNGFPGDIIQLGEDEGIGQFLVLIDKNTGEGTEIGPLGDRIGYDGNFITDISFREDGVLFAYFICQSCQRSGSILKTTNNVEELEGNALGILNLNTGAFTPVGETGVQDSIAAIGFTAAQVLDHCATSFLKEADFLESRMLNQFSGVSTYVRDIIPPADFADFRKSISSKDADMTSGNMYGFFLAEEDDDDDGPSPAELATRNIAATGSFLTMIDPNTGLLNIIGQTAGTQEAMLAIAVKGEPRMVPTMSEYGLIITGILFLGAAVLYLRRRRLNTEI